LDAYLPHNWMQAFSVFRQERSNVYAQFENNMQSFQHILGFWPVDSKNVPFTYRDCPPDLVANLWGYGYFGGGRGGKEMMRKGAVMEFEQSARNAEALAAPAAAAGLADANGVAEGRRALQQDGKFDRQNRLHGEVDEKAK